MVVDWSYIGLLTTLHFGYNSHIEGVSSMVSYVVIGNHIKQARLRLSITQEEAAFRAGISAAYYSKIERGVLRPNIDRLAAISQALSVPLDSLFKGAMLPDAGLLENLPVRTEEFDQYMHEVGRKVDERTKIIIMRICGELSNLPDHDS